MEEKVKLMEQHSIKRMLSAPLNFISFSSAVANPINKPKIFCLLMDCCPPALLQLFSFLFQSIKSISLCELMIDERRRKQWSWNASARSETAQIKRNFISFSSRSFILLGSKAATNQLSSARPLGRAS